MGEVYLAQDTQLDRPIALKLLLPQFTRDEDRLHRFKHEARAISALNHPNILTIYEIGEAGSDHFIATEFINGVTLRQHMQRVRMKMTEALDIAMQLAAELAAAHAAGIMHRDIKPEIIMVRPDGYIKVLDFGLAKLFEERATDSAALTMPMVETAFGVVMGTVSYMSPEQARGLKLDARTDIWSLGVILYEMAAGRVPFEGPTTSHVIVSILEKEPEPLRGRTLEVSADLQQIVTKALAKDREARYLTIRDLLKDLQKLNQLVELEAETERPTKADISGKTTVVRSSEKMLGSAKNQDAGSSTETRAPSSRRRRSQKTIDSLAVLPLLNVSAELDAEYLCDGITESIINTLSQLSKLRVAPRSTIFRYKGREVDPQHVGRDLGVRAVLIGRVFQHGDKLIIGVELVDVVNDSQLWGERYNRKLSDILEVQEEIAKEISESLRFRLTAEEKRRLTKRYTENTKAYQLYLKGRYFWNKRSLDGLKKAIEYFNEAIEKDPTYALAYAGLADCHVILGIFGVLPPTEVMSKAKVASMNTLAIEDKLAEHHASLAYVRAFYEWDWSGAEREFERAIELKPNYAVAHHFYSFYLAAMGRLDEAIVAEKWAHELDPVSLIISTNIGMYLYYARQYDKAIEQLLNTLRMDVTFFPAHVFLGLAYEQKGMFEEAITELKKAINFSGGDLSLAGLGHAYAVSGKRDEAQKLLKELSEQSQHRYVSPYHMAMISAGLGEKEQSFEWLDKACKDRSGWLVFIKVDPNLDGFRSDPRFTDLLLRIGLT
jgi:serine/threonine protein kinase/Flp pilus assembly protein TadD